MSDQDYPKKCNRCGLDIIMSKRSGNWKAYEINNGAHICNNGNNNKKQEIPAEKIPNKITLAMVTKKLESIGIIINVERLMKQK
jgi:hypothetical protein